MKLIYLIKIMTQLTINPRPVVHLSFSLLLQLITQVSSVHGGVEAGTLSSKPFIRVLKSCCEFQNSYQNGSCSDLQEDHFRYEGSYQSGAEDGSFYQFRKTKASFCKNGRPFYIESFVNLNEVELTEFVSDAKEDYCIDSFLLGPSATVSVLVGMCEPPEAHAQCIEGEPCLKKCCPEDEVGKMLRKNVTWELDCKKRDNVHDIIAFLHHRGALAKDGPGLVFKNEDTSRHVQVLHGHEPQCSNLKYSYDSFKLLPNGEAAFAYGVQSWVDLKDYCVEADTEIVNISDGSNADEISWAVGDKKAVLWYCWDEVVNQVKSFAKTQLLYCSISLMMLSVTITVYLVLWKDHNVQGWSQFAFIVSAFLYFFMRVIYRIYELASDFHLNSPIPARIDTLCTFGVFANLVNLSFNLLCTFRNPKLQGRVREWRDLRGLIIGQVLCWGLSVFAVLMELFIDYEVGLNIQLYILATLLFCNLIISLATGAVIYNHFQCRKKLPSTHLQDNDVWKMVKLFIRLFSLTGVIWTLKVFEFFFKGSSFRSNWFWESVQFLTYTIGVVYFCVFVLNTKMIQGLKKRFPCLRTKDWVQPYSFSMSNRGSSSKKTTVRATRFTSNAGKEVSGTLEESSEMLDISK